MSLLFSDVFELDTIFLTMQNPLSIIGIIFLLLAGVIIRTQLGAKNCPRHTRFAGILAWIVAIVCLGAGGYLVFSGLDS